MNRRELLRNSFLNAPQNETLTALGEVIIPATGTPGAKAAFVNRFLDLVLSVLLPETQREFLDSLMWFDKGAMARYKASFVNLSDDEKQDFVNLVAWPHTHVGWGETVVNFDGHEHFERMKQRIAGAYSCSQVGNFVSIDSNLKDAWGIPALHFSTTHGENEKALHEDAAASAAEMHEAVGAKNIEIRSTVGEPGVAIHELGTARMSIDHKTSVTDSYCRLHDVENVFAMDGACFVSSGCQSPTLTMTAITVRACDRLIDRFKKHEI